MYFHDYYISEHLLRIIIYMACVEHIDVTQTTLYISRIPEILAVQQRYLDNITSSLPVVKKLTLQNVKENEVSLIYETHVLMTRNFQNMQQQITLLIGVFTLHEKKVLIPSREKHYKQNRHRQHCVYPILPSLSIYVRWRYVYFRHSKKAIAR